MCDFMIQGLLSSGCLSVYIHYKIEMSSHKRRSKTRNNVKVANQIKVILNNSLACFISAIS